MKVGLYPGKVIGKFRDGGWGISVGWSGQDGDERTWWYIKMIGACWWIRIDRRWFSWWTINEGCGIRDCHDRRGLWWVWDRCGGRNRWDMGDGGAEYGRSTWDMVKPDASSMTGP
jgi:hypothetical protein